MCGRQTECKCVCVCVRGERGQRQPRALRAESMFVPPPPAVRDVEEKRGAPRSAPAQSAHARTACCAQIRRASACEGKKGGNENEKSLGRRAKRDTDKSVRRSRALCALSLKLPGVIGGAGEVKVPALPGLGGWWCSGTLAARPAANQE